MLEETSNNTAEENQRLVKNLNELDSRVQALEAKAALGEVSTSQKVKISLRVYSSEYYKCFIA